jgi:pimeloyl-ACP methyl ester carboxylesterase
MKLTHSIIANAFYAGTFLLIVSLAAECFAQTKLTAATAPARLQLPGESLTIQDRPAFIYMPEEAKRSTPQPWIFYAPTLPAYPDEAERWMHEQFLAAGIAVAGIDVGEAYGSPLSHPTLNAFYDELTTKRGFAKKPCLFGRSRGGLWVSSWAIAHPERVAGIIGIYPVYDFRTYPKIETAAPAYGVTAEELTQRNSELNPIERIDVLVKAKIPITIIHGDDDVVVPLKENSLELQQRYERGGEGALVKLIIAKGQGHNFWEGFFKEQQLVDFAIQQARVGAK